MSIEQSDVVDIFGIDKVTGAVTLAISDHLDWSDESQHLHLLQEKLNAYFEFIESGELINSCPVAIGRRVEIRVFAKYDLPEAGRVFLADAGGILGNSGVALKFQFLPET